MTKKEEKLSEEQLNEKQILVSKLADDLTRTLKSSEVMRAGMNNKELILDVLMGIGLFTASVVRVADKVLHAKDVMKEFYEENILPGSYELYDEAYPSKQTEDKILFS